MPDIRSHSNRRPPPRKADDRYRSRARLVPQARGRSAARAIIAGVSDEMRSDPSATQRRYESLRAYMDMHVLGRSGFCCTDADRCRGSLRPADLFAAGQLSYVGRHFDMQTGGRPYRVMVLGMDTGRPDESVTLDRRRQQVYDRIPEPFSRRNPHMRGTTLALRALFGKTDWDDASQEWIEIAGGESVHLLDAYAMANSRLCSAFRAGSTNSTGTRQMSAHCLRHLRATLEILEPHVVVVQGSRLRPSLQPLIDNSERISPNLEFAELAGVETALASFAHPSYPGPKFNWSWPSSPYFQSVVLPTLLRARDHRSRSPAT